MFSFILFFPVCLFLGFFWALWLFVLTFRKGEEPSITFPSFMEEPFSALPYRCFFSSLGIIDIIYFYWDATYHLKANPVMYTFIFNSPGGVFFRQYPTLPNSSFEFFQFLLGHPDIFNNFILIQCLEVLVAFFFTGFFIAFFAWLLYYLLFIIYISLWLFFLTFFYCLSFFFTSFEHSFINLLFNHKFSFDFFYDLLLLFCGSILTFFLVFFIALFLTFLFFYLGVS